MLDVLEAGFWGLIAGLGLFLGALVGYFVELRHHVIATIMGFGGGVLISILSFDLMEEAYELTGFEMTAAGFLAGGLVFSTANWLLARHGAQNRKRCGQCVQQPSEEQHPGSGISLFLGALVDGIPESLVIGLSLIGGGMIPSATLAGFFLANVPQGLSSASGMKDARRSARYVLGAWGGLTLASGVAALLGYSIFGGLSTSMIALMSAFAAGGLLAMLTETMIPEAFDQASAFIGLITVTGFLAAFVILKISLH
ncbi:ZIP family metal transporter [Methanosarcina horonobensis]|uniref:ZIP family metal transporter n=1 Tax=Methanosarcina horonobensis TaxID=418008 RepID=UPI00064E84BC|nr:ZIP family zinc transporter [Methanosarcina horonobensis]